VGEKNLANRSMEKTHLFVPTKRIPNGGGGKRRMAKDKEKPTERRGNMKTKKGAGTHQNNTTEDEI